MHGADNRLSRFAPAERLGRMFVMSLNEATNSRSQVSHAVIACGCRGVTSCPQATAASCSSGSCPSRDHDRVERLRDEAPHAAERADRVAGRILDLQRGPVLQGAERVCDIRVERADGDADPKIGQHGGTGEEQCSGEQGCAPAGEGPEETGGMHDGTVLIVVGGFRSSGRIGL